MQLADGETLSVSELMADIDRHVGNYIRVSGTVMAVCPYAGHWLELADTTSPQPLFVQLLFAGQEMGRVPPEAKGRRAIVEGRLIVTELSEAEQRHYAAEKGASEEDLAQIVGIKRTVQLVCEAAEVEGVQPAAPRPCEREPE